MGIQPKAQVLVVDDDPLLLQLLVDTLTAIGYAVTGVPGGLQALDTLTTRRFDLIVTDIKMPNLDGVQLLKKVRRLYPDLPVVFITGVATPDIINSALPYGFLLKPFRIQHIEELIKRTLRRADGQSGNAVRKVLIVESDDRFREFLVETLNHSEYIPFAATDTAETVRELENGTFDVVLAELELRRHEGRQLAEIMHQDYPHIPLIFMSSVLSGEQVIEGQSTNVIQKPFHAGALLELLDQLSFSSSEH